MKKNAKRKGFTIVELVIVIAVIAILATVLVPTFGNVINNAKDSAAKQEAKNAYTEYIADVAASGNVASYCVYQADANRFVAIENGSVIGVYKTKEDALAAMVSNPTEELVDTGDGKLWVYGGESNGSEGEGEGGNEGNQTPVAPVTVYSILNEQQENAMMGYAGLQPCNGGPYGVGTEFITKLEGKTVKKLVGMFKTDGTTAESYTLTATVHNSSDGSVVSTYNLTIPASDLNGETWTLVEIDVDIKLEAGQRLCFNPNSDTAKLGYM